MAVNNPYAKVRGRGKIALALLSDRARRVDVLNNTPDNGLPIQAKVGDALHATWAQSWQWRHYELQRLGEMLRCDALFFRLRPFHYTSLVFPGYGMVYVRCMPGAKSTSIKTLDPYSRETAHTVKWG